MNISIDSILSLRSLLASPLRSIRQLLDRREISKEKYLGLKEGNFIREYLERGGESISQSSFSIWAEKFSTAETFKNMLHFENFESRDIPLLDDDLTQKMISGYIDQPAARTLLNAGVIDVRVIRRVFLWQKILSAIIISCSVFAATALSLLVLFSYIVAIENKILLSTSVLVVALIFSSLCNGAAKLCAKYISIEKNIFVIRWTRRGKNIFYCLNENPSIINYIPSYEDKN